MLQLNTYPTAKDLHRIIREVKQFPASAADIFKAAESLGYGSLMMNFLREMVKDSARDFQNTADFYRRAASLAQRIGSTEIRLPPVFKPLNRFVPSTPQNVPAAARSSVKRWRDKINYQLESAGMTRWGLRKPETKQLIDLLQKDETIGGVIYGHGEEGLVMLAATNKRILFLDRKPLFTKTEDITYDAVSGVTYEWVGLSGTIILHTKMGDFKISSLNQRAARNFERYVDQRCIEHVNGNFNAL